MTPILQLVVFVGAMAALVRYGFYRDKQEHAPKAESQQRNLYFPESSDLGEREQRGAALSRLS